MDYSCNSCLYANSNEEGGVLCDRKLLLCGDMVVVSEKNVDKSCTVHSSRKIENWRYIESRRYLNECDDSCGICGRLVKLSDGSQYKYINVKDKDGNSLGEKLQCKICEERGRS